MVGRPLPKGDDLLLALIPTPPNEGSPAVRQEGQDQITFDTEWLVEHALQLGGVLIGGARRSAVHAGSVISQTCMT